MRNRQRGMGYMGYMILALVLGLLIKIVTVAGGPYLDYYYIGHSVKAVLKENENSNVSIADLKVAMSTQFQVNGVTDQSPGDLTYVKEGNKFTITVNYEVRKPFLGNIDAVFVFKNTYSSEETSGAQ